MKTYRIGKLESKFNNFFLNKEVVDNFKDGDILSKFGLSFFVLSFCSMIGVMPPLMFGWELPNHVLFVVFGFVFFCLFIFRCVINGENNKIRF